MEKFVLLVFLFVVASVTAEKNSTRNLLLDPELVYDYEYIVEDYSLLDADVCNLLDEEWSDLKKFFVEFMVGKNLINYDSGTFNFNYMAKIATKKDQVKNFIGGQCDEEYNQENNMDDKILAVTKSFLKRQASCPGSVSTAVACKLPAVNEIIE